MKRLIASVLVVIPIVAGVRLSAADEPKKKDGALGLAGAVKVDEWNDDVKDHDKGDGKPCRGGTLRLRFPIDPKSLCPLLDNDNPTGTVYNYMNDFLLTRDPETFEYLPILAKSWKTCDVVKLKDGTRLEGRVVEDEEGKPLVFSEGTWKHTVARFEVEIDDKAGKITWKEPHGKGSVEGTISYWPGGKYTVSIDEKPAKTREIKREDIGTVEEELEGGKKESYPAVLRESVYEFTMRKGPRWHDGKPVTVDDLLWTFETILNKDVLCGHTKSYIADTFEADPKVAAKKLTDDTVRFQLKKQYFAALATFGGILYILPSHKYGAEKFKGDPKGFAEHFNKHPHHRAPVGSGRYKFGNWEPSKFVEVVRNEDYWASQPGQTVPWIDPLMPYLDKIQWITIQSKNAGLKALLNGEVDADFEIEQIDFENPDYKTDAFKKKYTRVKHLGTPYTYIGWNVRRPDVEPAAAKRNFFKDVKVRTAMTHLIDRQKILNTIHYGLGEMVTGPFFSRGPNCDTSIKPLDYNPEKAKTLLDQAGWIDHDGDGIRDKDGEKFEFTYNVHNARDYHLKIAEIVKQDIEKAGIKVNIKSTDFNSFIDIVNSRKFDAIRFAWGEPDPVDTDPFQIWHSSQWDNKGSNHTGFGNPEVDDILVKARRELDFKKRQRMFRKVHKIIAEEQPYTFLFNLYELYFYDKKFRNVKFYILGNPNPYYYDEWFIPKELQKG
ncbi:MAG: ABC transporter substrate-binding protein [Planctomycetota bacterium]